MYIKQADLITFTDLGKLFTLMPPHREVITKEQSMTIKLLAATVALTLSAAAFASPAEVGFRRIASKDAASGIQLGAVLFC